MKTRVGPEMQEVAPPGRGCICRRKTASRGTVQRWHALPFASRIFVVEVTRMVPSGVNHRNFNSCFRNYISLLSMALWRVRAHVRQARFAFLCRILTLS